MSSMTVPSNTPACFLSRREMLRKTSVGFGQVALASLLAETGSVRLASAATSSGAVQAEPPHLPARAKYCIFVFMSGGPSQVDTFDYKPALERDHGQPNPLEKGSGDTRTHELMGPLWKFRPYGESGIHVSDIFPHLGGCVDDICFIHSMVTETPGHGMEQLRVHTGSDRLVRPTLGSWAMYGLGAETQELPGFIVLTPQLKYGNLRAVQSAFLPAQYAMVPLGQSLQTFKDVTFPNLVNRRLPPELQRYELEMAQRLNRRQVERVGDAPDLEGRIRTLELAYKMQTAAPETLDFSDESQTTLDAYGVDAKGETENFARQCLLARRLVERGVRFIEIYHAPKSHDGGWDQHNQIKHFHPRHAWEIDQPIAALIRDLKSRGLLDETLIVWGGEFGRSPGVQKEGSPNGLGRDHHPWGFTFGLAGGGVKGGLRYGTTDDYGYHAVENPVNFHDLHATILHLMGLDHQRLTYNVGGQDVRLTDALNGLDGNVVTDIIA